jgi:hypothetical protein
MAEQENGSSPLARALAKLGDRWTPLVVEAQHPSLATDRYQLAHAPFLSAISGLILLSDGLDGRVR